LINIIFVGGTKMILTGKEILKRMEKGDIVINPFDEKRLNPNSYNLTLHEKLLVYDCDILDMKKDNPTNEIIIPEDTGFVLRPGEFYLGRTNEYTITKGLVPVLDGRSSIGRLGIFVHVTAGYGDNGFEGFWTLEIICVKPIRIYPNVPICQIRYHEIIGEEVYYSSGKYQRNNGVQASQLFRELTTK